MIHDLNDLVVAGLLIRMVSRQSLTLDPRSVQVGSEMDKVTLEHASFFPPSNSGFHCYSIKVLVYHKDKRDTLKESSTL